MDRLFKRDEEHTKMLIEGSGVYSQKREQQKFEHYIYTFIGKAYKKSTAAYFGEAVAHGYIETILDLAGRLEQLQQVCGAASEQVEVQRWELIQALAIGIRKPKLLFSSNGSVKYKAVYKFEAMLQKVYREWDAFQEEMDICFHYMERGIVRLNRPAETDCLVQEREAMASEIDKVYRAYYFQLLALDLDWKPKIPEIRMSSNLFLNITERPWLVPLAHIMLIRDAQFQMMRKEKYKDSELLLGELDFLNMGKPTQEQRKERDGLTIYYAMRIRSILAKYLKGKKRTDCRAAFGRYFREKYESENKGEEPGFLNEISSIFASINAHRELMDKMSIFDVPDFSVPSCHIRETALMIAEQLQLTPVELRELEKAMPNVLWSQSALVKSLCAFEGGVKDKLAECLAPIRTLVNAKEYYSGAKTEDMISQNLLKAAEKIYADSFEKINTNGKDKKMSLAWKAYKDMIYFEDLTRGALFLSRAIEPCSASFSFFRHCRSALEQSLEKYKTSSYIKNVLEIPQKSKKILRELNCIEEYAVLRKKLMVNIAGIESESNLSFQKAVKFLKSTDVLAAKAKSKRNTKSGQKRQWEYDIQELAQSCTKIPIKTLNQEGQKHLCFDVYSSLARKAVSIIEDYVMDVLHSNVLHLYKNKRR